MKCPNCDSNDSLEIDSEARTERDFRGGKVVESIRVKILFCRNCKIFYGEED